MDELTFAPLTVLAAAIRNGDISATEVVTAHLQRIEAVNPRLNAVVTLTADAALQQARAADAALARGAVSGPLHGVPMTIKDSLDTAGVVSTWGTPGRASFVPAADATVVARLKAAGAILLGKTNTPELTLSYETDNPIHGRTHNPYDLTRTPGGSSGGAAAIVAAGGAAFDIGSDTGGSIRLPAHCCGIAGIKPTSGRVPRTGHAIGPFGWLQELTQLGPMARTVGDLRLLLPVIAGPDGRDPHVVPAPLGDPHRVRLQSLRVAWHDDNAIRAAVPAIRELVRAAAESLAAAGVVVTEARPPGIEASLDLLGKLMRGVDGGAWVQAILAAAGTAAAESSLQRYLNLPTASATQMSAQIERWHRFRIEMLGIMRDFDAILCPVNAYPALLHGTFSGDNYPGFSYTMTYNLTGWPAAVVRCGASPEGLPLGVQVVARPWQEAIALAVAEHLEQEFGGWERPRELGEHSSSL